jgi:hypothetical protein
MATSTVPESNGSQINEPESAKSPSEVAGGPPRTNEPILEIDESDPTLLQNFPTERQIEHAIARVKNLRLKYPPIDVLDVHNHVPSMSMGSLCILHAQSLTGVNRVAHMADVR